MSLISAADIASTKYILLIDPDAAHAKSAVSLFEGAGMMNKLGWVSDVPTALQHLRERSGPSAIMPRPAVVLLNPSASEPLGATEVLSLRGERVLGTIPIVVLVRSRNTKPPADRAAIADSYLLKPLTLSSLMACWRYWTQINLVPTLGR